MSPMIYALKVCKVRVFYEGHTNLIIWINSNTFLILGTPGFSDEFAFMSNCLGVGAIALTKDNFVILMERAKWTGEYPGKIDRPGTKYLIWLPKLN